MRDRLIAFLECLRTAIDDADRADPAPIDEPEPDDPADEPIPIDTTRLSTTDVTDALGSLEWIDRDSLYRYGRETVSRYPLYDQYRAVDRPTFTALLDEVVIDIEYRSDWAECNDYADRLSWIFRQEYGINTVGRAFSLSGLSHAYNVVVFDDLSVGLVEPQGLEFVDVSDGGRYDPRWTVILL